MALSVDFPVPRSELLSPLGDRSWKRFEDLVAQLPACGDWIPISFATEVAFSPDSNGTKIVAEHEARARYRVDSDSTFHLQVERAGSYDYVDDDPVHEFAIDRYGDIRRTYPNGYGSFGREHISDDSLKYLTDTAWAAVVARRSAVWGDIVSSAATLQSCDNVKVAFESRCVFGRAYNGVAGEPYIAHVTVSRLQGCAYRAPVSGQWTILLQYGDENERKIDSEGTIDEATPNGHGLMQYTHCGEIELQHMLAAIRAAIDEQRLGLPVVLV